jgi:hypothetical protein
MTQLMQISHPFLFFIPIMALFVGIQFLTNQRRKRGFTKFDAPNPSGQVNLLKTQLSRP